ncbi:plasmid partition protein ParG [Rhodopirellula bahusiensis]|uniref:plasmid partition protein ParG n=1 Tax=Rhodopirellula bahusiensis TaxID=2014065 RepID=UPI003D656320
MSKEISFHGRPPSKGKTRAENAFASLGIKTPSEKTKRLTVDIPTSLHSRVKLKCVQQETSIAEVVRELLEQRFPGE